MQNPLLRDSTAGRSKDFYSFSAKENEYRINRISGLIAILAQLTFFFMMILDYAEVFVLNSGGWMTACLIILPFMLSVIVLTLGVRLEKSWLKYYITACDSIVVTVLFAFLSMHVLILLVYPMIKSILYFDRKVNRFSCLLSLLSLIAGHLMSLRFSIVFDDPVNVDLRHSLLYGLLPRMIELLFIALIIRLINHLTIKMMSGGYTYAKRVEETAFDEKRSTFEIVRNLATISENKSRETGEHISHVFDYMNILVHKAGYNDEECFDISLAAMLHDVGKLCIDEKILSKPGRLSPDEYEIIKQHTDFGRDLLTSSDNAVLKIAARIAEQHHERWDGTGYHHMIGEQIDRLSCIMSVVDVFDALTSQRCYKDAWTPEDAYEEILKGKGTQFSPEAVDLFVSSFPEIVKVYRNLSAPHAFFTFRQSEHAQSEKEDISERAYLYR